MSIFGSIMSKIFGGSASAETSTAHASETPSVSAAAQGSDGATGSASSAAAPSTSGAPSPAPTSDGPAGSGKGSVDVGEVLANLAAQKGGPSDYKRSIVDLLKLLDLDSSITARKELADELHYTGDKEDSASMNVWLHKQVVQKLADNGGKVPDELKQA